MGIQIVKYILPITQGCIADYCVLVFTNNF